MDEIRRWWAVSVVAEGRSPMACGNNKVSRSALNTPPRPPGAVSVIAPRHERPPPDQQVQRTATAITSARAEIDRTTSPHKVRSAVSAAHQALAQARRAGVGREVLRSLEREVAEVVRAASKALARAEEQAKRSAEHRRHAAMLLPSVVDRFAPTMLGVSMRVAVPPSDAPPGPARDEKLVAATQRAQRAVNRCPAMALDKLAAEKKAAQRALSSARRDKAPASEIRELESAFKTLQRAESKRRSAPSADEALPFASVAGSGLAVAHTETLRAGEQIGYEALKPATQYTFGEQTYITDANGQPAYAAGELHRQDDPKSLRHRRGAAIGKLGNDGDEGGHLIAAMFGGFGSGPNLVPQNMTLNRNRNKVETYGELEARWKRLLELGARVHVDIRLQESSTNPDRPEGILARWRVDAGDVDVSSVLNEGPSGTYESFFPNEPPT